MASGTCGALTHLTRQVARGRLQEGGVKDFFEDLSGPLERSTRFLSVLAEMDYSSQEFKAKFQTEFTFGPHGLHAVLPLLEDTYSFIVTGTSYAGPCSPHVARQAIKSLELAAAPMLKLVKYFRSTVDRALWDPQGFCDLWLALRPGKDGQVYFDVRLFWLPHRIYDFIELNLLLQLASTSNRLSLLSLDFGIDETDDFINAAVKDFGDFQEGSFTISRESILLGENGLDSLLDIFSYFLDAIDPLKFNQYHELFDMFVALSSAIARKASNVRKVSLHSTSKYTF